MLNMAYNLIGVSTLVTLVHACTAGQSSLEDLVDPDPAPDRIVEAGLQEGAGWEQAEADWRRLGTAQGMRPRQSEGKMKNERAHDISS